MMEEQNYISVDAMPLEQISNKSMFVGMLSVKEIVQVVKFTERKVIAKDPFDISPEDDTDYEQQYYQRVRDSERSYKIKKFFLKQIYNKYNFENNQVSPLAVFPSSILLGCQMYPEKISKERYLELIKESSDEVNDYCFLQNNEIIVAKHKNILIIDGQHRIAGLENLLSDISQGQIEIKRADRDEVYFKNLPPLEYIQEVTNNFKFLVTFLIDFDRYEQAELFAMVNFNQKPVNKSFYYDIFGSIKRGRSLEKLLHDLTAFLNFNEGSPLKAKVKMLGTGEGFMSQAFLVEALMPHFKKGVFSDVYLDYLNNGERFRAIPGYLKNYLQVFFEVFIDFLPKNEDAYKNILLKTTGMGAIVHLIPYLNSKIQEISGKKALDLTEKDFKAYLSKILNKIKDNGEKYFGENSEYAKSAGKGLQSKLYNKMMEDLKTVDIPTMFPTQ